MKTVTVAASKKYDVIIGNDLLPQIGHFLSPIQKSSQVAIISDHQVWAIYGQSVSDALKCSGYHPTSFVFPSGESSKSGKTYLEILNFLAENKITRSDMIIALGGGVVGDMAGFCAATYLLCYHLWLPDERARFGDHCWNAYREGLSAGKG